MKIALFLVAILFPFVAMAQDSYRSFYDSSNKPTHTWTRYQGSDTTIVKDNTNRITGYRQHQGDRIEIRDNANRIIGYENED